MASEQGDLRFDPPGPGSWELDPLHFPRPVTRYWAEIHPDAFIRGFRDFTAFYGMLIDTMEMRYVNGFAYRKMVPVSPEEFPKREKRAEEVFAKKLWREQLRDWDETVKPISIKAHRDLQSVDPDALSDEDLVAYLARCRDHHAAMISQHMRFTGAAMLPIGDLLTHAGEWTDLPPADLLVLMRGASPVSGGASSELETLVAAIRKDPSAQKPLESDDDPGKVLMQVRGIDSDAGRAMSAYLELAGNRLLDGFDISERFALELPDVLLRAIRATVEGRSIEGPNFEESAAAIRSRVPDQYRAEFDELLDDALLMYRIRDERGVFSDIWASGIMRRAAMAAGRRVADSGRIHDPQHFVDAGFDEMRALVSGAEGPSGEELAARFDYRASHTAKDAPPGLGDPSSPPPDPSGLPPALARVMRAVGIAIGTMFMPSQEPHEDERIRGLSASGGTYVGPARRVAGPKDFDRIVKGDVLVTESTTEAFNILLPLLGALVTDSGGLLSHAAIIAREYGIPGVVGTRDATDRIPDGATVRVDGDAGEVTMQR